MFLDAQSNCNKCIMLQSKNDIFRLFRGCVRFEVTSKYVIQ